MDHFLEVHKGFLPDRSELSRLEEQAAHIRASQYTRTAEANTNQSYSRFFGRGLDFEEVRAYSPGDDMRAMDWRVTARTGKPHIKVYREERQRAIILVIDVAGTMLFGSEKTTKLAQAIRVAALFAFSAVQQRDRVGVLLTGELGGLEVPPCSPFEAMWRVVDFLSDDGNRSGRILPWGGMLAAMPRGRTVTVLSDFMNWQDRDWQALGQAASRHGVSAVQMYDPLECAIPDIGPARMSGFDGGQPFLIDTGSRRGREAYAACWEKHQNGLLHRLSNAHVPYWSVSTTDDPSSDVGHMVSLLQR